MNRVRREDLTVVSDYIASNLIKLNTLTTKSDLVDFKYEIGFFKREDDASNLKKGANEDILRKNKYVLNQNIVRRSHNGIFIFIFLLFKLDMRKYF